MEDTTMKKNFDNLYEKLGGTYREESGHLIPNVTLPEQTDYQIGKYGRMHLNYIKQHRRGRYTTLLTEGKLNARLHEIDLEANEMLETIIPHLATKSGIDED
ncbi:MAG: TnpV protein, partial [Clostridia bacterium]|nr:TnpV protein [Clostridia bacterium]